MGEEVVIAVTRAGLGRWLRFDSFEEADEHPVVQYGDVVMTHEKAFMTQWTRLELPGLLEKIGMSDLPLEQHVLEHNAPRIWARMIATAETPPQNPEEICEMVRSDRKKTKTERKQKMTAQAEAKTDGNAKRDRVAEQKKRRYSGEARVTLLADANGNPYGPKNNPKRAGTKTHARFALYANGLTVEELLAKGADFGDFKYDEDKGFVKFTEPTA